MIYSVELEIPAETTKLAAVEIDLRANLGTISQVWVRWRWGSGNLCGVTISREGVQLWPTTGTEWFPSNVQEMTWQESYQVDDYPLDFQIRGYNTDDSFPHTVWIAVNLQPGIEQSNVNRFVQLLMIGA